MMKKLMIEAESICTAHICCRRLVYSVYTRLSVFNSRLFLLNRIQIVKSSGPII